LLVFMFPILVLVPIDERLSVVDHFRASSAFAQSPRMRTAEQPRAHDTSPQ